MADIGKAEVSRPYVRVVHALSSDKAPKNLKSRVVVYKKSINLLMDMDMDNGWKAVPLA